MEQRRWMFLSNHAHVLVALEAGPDVLLRDVAALVGITERAVHQIIVDLELAGVVARTRVGRRNRYTINRAARLRHPLEADVAVGRRVVRHIGKLPTTPATDRRRCS